MNTPRFPRSPDIHNRPFKDGTNPFTDSEDGSAGTAASSPSSYGSPTADPRSNRPVEYEAFLPNRSKRIFSIGLIGFVIAWLSLMAAVIASTAVGWAEGVIQILPLSLSGVALTVPAWYLAHCDLRAIRAGAMDSAGRRKTRWAYWLGLLGTMVGFLPAAAGLTSLFLYLLE